MAYLNIISLLFWGNLKEERGNPKGKRKFTLNGDRLKHCYPSRKVKKKKKRVGLSLRTSGKVKKKKKNVWASLRTLCSRDIYFYLIQGCIYHF